MKKLLLLIFPFLFFGTKAQTWVTIPDANFANYLQSIIPAAMNGNQMDITNPLVTTSTHTISAVNLGISNLTGIQYFTSLAFLNCDNNYTLTFLPPLPSTLVWLECSANALSSLPALPSSLLYLECAINPITSIPTLPNNLQSLDCGLNSITSLPPLPNSLKHFRCSNDNLTTLPTLPDSLQFFWCDNCNITCFPIFPNTITSFSISPNPYNCLPNYISAMDSAQSATPLCAPANSNGCPVVAGINQFANNTQIKIYPNPAQNNFTVQVSDNQKQTIQVYNVNGKLILSQIINGTTTIDASNFNAGIYNISITNNAGVTNKRLVVVQ